MKSVFFVRLFAGSIGFNWLMVTVNRLTLNWNSRWSRLIQTTESGINIWQSDLRARLAGARGGSHCSFMGCGDLLMRR